VKKREPKPPGDFLLLLPIAKPKPAISNFWSHSRPSTQTLSLSHQPSRLFPHLSQQTQLLPSPLSISLSTASHPLSSPDADFPISPTDQPRQTHGLPPWTGSLPSNRKGAARRPSSSPRHEPATDSCTDRTETQSLEAGGPLGLAATWNREEWERKRKEQICREKQIQNGEEKKEKQTHEGETKKLKQTVCWDSLFLQVTAGREGHKGKSAFRSQRGEDAPPVFLWPRSLQALSPIYFYSFFCNFQISTCFFIIIILLVYFVNMVIMGEKNMIYRMGVVFFFIYVIEL